MGGLANRVLTIAVGVFVTIMITSSVLLILNQMKDIYAQVYATDVSIQSQFDEFDAYDNSIKSPIDIANAMKRYSKNSLVTIYKDSELILKLGAEPTEQQQTNYNTQYNNIVVESEEFIRYRATVVKDEDTGKVTITFAKIV